MLDASFLATCACALVVDYCWVFDAAYWLLVRPMPGMWAVGYICFIRWFLFWLKPIFLFFRGGAVHFSFFLVTFWLRVLFLVFCWALPFW